MADDQQSFSVILADVEGEWQNKLVCALIEEGHRVTVTEDGNEARAYLAGDKKCDLIILGRDLRALSAFDALFLASRDREGRTAPKPKIMLAVDIKADIDLQSLWERRGVNAFIDPAAELQEQARLVNDVLCHEMRRNRRFQLNRPAVLSWDNTAIEGDVLDISADGVLFACAKKRARDLPPKGSAVTVTMDLASTFSRTMSGLALRGAPSPWAFGGGGFGSPAGEADSVAESHVTLPGFVRRHTTRSRLLGDLVFVGVQFGALPPEASECIAALIDTLAKKERKA